MDDYHRKTYGPDYPYENFAGTFNEQSEQWDPEAWAGLFAYFYNHNPEGLVNDRWFQLPRRYLNPVGKLFLKWMAKRLMNEGGITLPRVPHCDYRTTEYGNLKTQAPFKWESVRGIGNSFTTTSLSNLPLTSKRQT